ncbi:MAG: LolA family protein [Ferruginibacter sp.]
MRKKLFRCFVCFLLLSISATANAQDIQQLVAQTKSKLALVKDYVATGTMKTNVSFLKVPVSPVTLYYMAPDRIKLQSEKGVTFVPKGAVNLNLAGLINQESFLVVDGGSDKVNDKPVRIARLLPNDPKSDIVLLTLNIDPVNQVVLKASTTTRDNGTYELQFTYGKYRSQGLPDQIVFSFNANEYKLPKGITFDFDNGAQLGKPAAQGAKNKGEAIIDLRQYTINKGAAAAGFN